MSKILNVHNFHSNKTNKDYSIIQILRPISTRERNQGYLGDTISEDVFLPDNLVGSVGLSDIGHDIELVYEVVGGKANLVNIQKGGK